MCWRLLILLDAFERIERRLEQFQEWGDDWRAKASAELLTIVLATRRSLAEIYTPCRSDLTIHHALQRDNPGALQSADWQQLVNAGLRRADAPPARDIDLGLIEELAGGLPYYTQLAAAALWRNRNHDQARTMFTQEVRQRFKEQ
jgi:hypothetical protein